MLNRFAICVLLAGVLFGAVANAQQPKPAAAPSPGPAPGTREYTQAALKKYDDAIANYEAVSKNPNADLEDLNIAYYSIGYVADWATKAVALEAEGAHGVDVARVEYQAAQKTYEKLNDGKHALEAGVAQLLMVQAEKKLGKARRDAQARILQELNHKIDPNAVKMTAQHSERQTADNEAREKAWQERLDRDRTRLGELAEEALRRIREEAEKKAKAEAEKKAQPTPSPEPKKTSCAPQGGMTGAIGNLNCQMQQSGSGH